MSVAKSIVFQQSLTEMNSQQYSATLLSKTDSQWADFSLFLTQFHMTLQMTGMENQRIYLSFAQKTMCVTPCLLSSAKAPPPFLCSLQLICKYFIRVSPLAHQGPSVCLLSTNRKGHFCVLLNPGEFSSKRNSVAISLSATRHI